MPIQQMYVAHTVDVWCGHSTCMAWTQHMCDVHKAQTTSKSHFLVMSRSLVHDFGDRLGYVWEHFGDGLGWIGDGFVKKISKFLEMLICRIVREYLSSNQLLKTMTFNLLPENKK